MREILKLFFFAPGTRPWLVIACALFGALAEGIGFISLLPLLTLVTEGGVEQSSPVTAVVTKVLATIGLKPELLPLLSLVVFGTVLRSLLSLVAIRQVGYANATVVTNLRTQITRNLLAVRWDYFARQPLGRFANAVSYEAHRCSRAYEIAANFLASGILSMIYIVVAVFISWKLTIFSLCLGALIAVPLHVLVRIAKRAGASQTHELRELISFLTDTLNSIKPLKAMAKEPHFAAVCAKKIRSVRKSIRREIVSQEARRTLEEVLTTICLAAVFYTLTAIWNYALSEVLVMGVLMARTMSTVGRLQNFYQKAIVLKAPYRNVRNMISETEAMAENLSGNLTPSLNVGCRFEEVSFTFGDKVVLDAISLDIPVHSVTVLTGPSGSGKTTITDLLLGLYRPDGGRILVDGVPLDTLDLRRWRAMIGYVAQELVLFHDTVLANVVLGDERIGEADVRAALEMVGAWEFVSRLPEGLMSSVGEKGTRLSGGQRQRIALARALATKPKLLILDEVSSALDPETEQDICRRVRQLSRDATILAITHRPAFLDIADRVYQIDAGMVAEVAPDTRAPAVSRA